MTVFDRLIKIRNEKGAGFLLLIDPDENNMQKLPDLIGEADQAGVDAFLVGASLLLSKNFEDSIQAIKETCDKPVIIFPGSAQQVSKHADAILYLTLVSSRNPEFLIGEQVKGAPIVKAAGIEPIPTGYMLIESGRVTSVQYVSNSMPIPSDKPDIARVHALAAQYMGMKLIYLEAGSGALYSVPDEMVSQVADFVDIPVIVGGGITTPEDARARVIAGASFVVTGNFFERKGNHTMISEFADAIHVKTGSGIEIE